MLLPGKRNTFKIVLVNQLFGVHRVVGEYVNLAEARKALKAERHKWKWDIFAVVLAIPISRQREYEEEQRELAKSRKPDWDGKSPITLRRVKIAIHCSPDLHADKVTPARPNRAKSSRWGRGSK